MSYLVYLEIFNKIPDPIPTASRLDPPKLIKGKVIPVIGAIERLTAIFKKACNTNQEVIPIASSFPKLSGDF